MAELISWLLGCGRHYMTGGNKGGARAGDEPRTGTGQSMSGFDPTMGADPIFSAAGRSEEQQQSQQASSQVCSRCRHPAPPSGCPRAMHLLAYTHHMRKQRRVGRRADQ